MQTSSESMRRARPDEAGILTALAMRSKAHWGYGADFMAAARVELTITPAAISGHEVWVLEGGDGRVIGFHHVIPGDPAILEDLWLEPDAIGTGRGRILWEHAVGVARACGAAFMDLVADPHAVGFYERMGAVRTGTAPSNVLPGRELPRMRLAVV